ncbi:MAG TPA: metallophosphoesterase [Pyrinomonadaceae bacterium]|nr:metallophosphoesterase [Pyrinomonadaceae bacterium]
MAVTRRQFLTGLVSAPLVAVSATSAYARLLEPYSYYVSETDVFIKYLPERFDGFRITQLTDVHHSQIVGLNEIRNVVQLAQQTKPDMFVLTGDYTTSYRRFIEPCAETLAALKAPEGTWAVLGNHDHYTDPELTTRALERNQIKVLNNANTTLYRGPDALQLSGVDDWTWNAANFSRAFYGLKKETATVLLSHQPRVLELEETSNVSLVLSGHTHGGQINLPFLGAPARFAVSDLKYAHGLFRRGDTHLYVSSGTGVIGLPVRLGVRPEIAVLRLRSA